MTNQHHHTSSIKPRLFTSSFNSQTPLIHSFIYSSAPFFPFDKSFFLFLLLLTPYPKKCSNYQFTTAAATTVPSDQWKPLKDRGTRNWKEKVWVELGKIRNPKKDKSPCREVQIKWFFKGCDLRREERWGERDGGDLFGTYRSTSMLPSELEKRTASSIFALSIPFFFSSFFRFFCLEPQRWGEMDCSVCYVRPSLVIVIISLWQLRPQS